jgi:2,4-dienoyl-CoA reductase-like NADH-dependent reductase (Old Yellow Enzyme family)
VGPDYPIGVKINAADFQCCGFGEDEAFDFVKTRVDLIEVSGGTYEKLAMTDGEDGREEKQSTKEREAYFIEFSKCLVEQTKVPVMCTGGWRSRDARLSALQNKKTHLIGFGRPSIESDLPHKIVSDAATGALVTRNLQGIENFVWCQTQFDRMVMGLEPDVDMKLEPKA